MSLQAPSELPDYLQPIAADLQAVGELMVQQCRCDVPLVETVSRYVIDAGGKRIRPVLVLLMSGALGYTDVQRLNAAAIVEFIHTATLLHDDVVDESSLRRGKATANHAFGNAASVLVGDFLYSRAFQMMVHTQNMAVMSLLADATNVIAEGEVLQLSNIGNLDLTEATYLEVIRSKTAKLFEASARLPAILYGQPQAVQDACGAYGTALGTAFQIIDDVLDYMGDAALMGKQLGDDLREGKVTLPIIYALERATVDQRKWLQDVLKSGINLASQPSDAELGRVVDFVQRCGAIELTRQCARHQIEQAQQQVASLSSTCPLSKLQTYTQPAHGSFTPFDYRQAMIDLATSSLVRMS